MAETQQSPLRRILTIPVEIIVGIYIIADSIIWALFVPVVRWLSGLELVKKLERWIDSLHPYVILVLLVVPFAFAELAKAVGVYLMSTGHFRPGMTIFISAYIVSIFVCERTLHAGKRKLMTIHWFAVSYTWVMAIKDRILGWFQETRIWKAATALREKARLAYQQIKDRVLAAFGRRPKRSLEHQ